MTLTETQKSDLLHVVVHELGHFATAFFLYMPGGKVHIYFNDNLQPDHREILGRAEHMTANAARDRALIGISGLIAEKLYSDANCDADELFDLICQPTSLSDSDQVDFNTFNSSEKRSIFDEAFRNVKSKLELIKYEVPQLIQGFEDQVNQGKTSASFQIESLLFPPTLLTDEAGQHNQSD